MSGLKPPASIDVRPARQPHACNTCRYLGRYKIYDLYVCVTSGSCICVVKDTITLREDSYYPAEIIGYNATNNDNAFEVYNRAILAGLIEGKLVSRDA